MDKGIKETRRHCGFRNAPAFAEAASRRQGVQIMEWKKPILKIRRRWGDNECGMRSADCGMGKAKKGIREIGRCREKKMGRWGGAEINLKADGRHLIPNS